MSAVCYAIFRIPASNLVMGMKRLQEAYSRRIMNQRDGAARRCLWVGSSVRAGGLRHQQSFVWDACAERLILVSEGFREKMMSGVELKTLGANPSYRSSAMGRDRREKD
mgnify:CR=1 FL=1